MTALPDHLLSSERLLRRAFPEGIDEATYWAILGHIYPHMADGNIVALMAHLTGRDDALVMNEVYMVGSGAHPQDERAFREASHRLHQAGFDEWVKEE